MYTYTIKYDVGSRVARSHFSFHLEAPRLHFEQTSKAAAAPPAATLSDVRPPRLSCSASGWLPKIEFAPVEPDARLRPS